MEPRQQRGLEVLGRNLRRAALLYELDHGWDELIVGNKSVSTLINTAKEIENSLTTTS